MNTPNHGISFTLAAVALVATASAQDSVSKQQGLPGDAVNAYSIPDQRNNYVVDLTTFTTSWGTKFGVAPLIKSSRDSNAIPQFFTQLPGAQAISVNRKKHVSFPFASYDVWNGAGFGVNDATTLNNPGSAVNTAGLKGDQFAVAFVESGGFSFLNSNVVGGIVNLQSTNPSRLYVSRIEAAQNANAGLCKNAAFGFGGVDADGNIAFRADGFGAAACIGSVPVTGNNYFLVNALARNDNVLNLIDDQYPLGGFDALATSWLVHDSLVAHNTPTVVPRSIAGLPFLIGSNFNKEYVRGVASPLAADLSHLAPNVTDHRGNVAFTTNRFPLLFGAASTWGTAAIIGKSTSGLSDTMNVFGLGAGGAVSGSMALTLPPVVADNSTGFLNVTLGPGPNEFDHYHSQVAFQGGNGQVAVRRDLKGNLLASAVVNYPIIGPLDNPIEYVAVARVTAPGVVQWTMAGYNDGSFDGSGAGGGTGKPILSGPGGSVIGRMVPLFTVTGGLPQGPSISSPMIDAVGNVWFLSAVELFTVNGSGSPVSVFTTALLRAVYDPAQFSYQLELALKIGDVFQGQNSTLNYRIQFLNIADSNSVDSATAWSGNIMESPHVTIGPACVQHLDPKQSESLGGMVLAAEIVYDVNGDGVFQKVTGASGNPSSPDQEYNVLLYVGSVAKPATSVVSRIDVPFGFISGVGTVTNPQVRCP